MKLKEELPEFPRNLEWINGSIRKGQVGGGVPILVHFWSVSCSLCKDGMSSIHKWKEQYENDLVIIAVHMPRTKEDVNVQLVRTLAQQFKIDHPICLDDELVMTKKFQNRIVPAFYLFDKNGLMRHYQSGEQGMWMLEKRIIRMINEGKK
ncbi:thioredoxin-like domain-containing protein [Psychrobacillus sp.]|uniref:thioredoxin-like domain-containing protein n=1 Tax=Psychrobacillus sp. TaxID=1871623 RepID=UPI0028BF3E2B|nr:thioredoxin-like domain-containing protein [Psychrobacillus sp.]